jgi:hypothetical protein
MSEELKRDARSTFVSLFMDGRNEHGTHLLEMNAHNIPAYMLDAFCEEYLAPKGENAERIFRAAERIGFATSSTVTAVFEYTLADDENDGYFEFVKISEPLTVLFWGGAADQRSELKEPSRD